VNQEPCFADEVVVVLVDGARSRKTHRVANVAKSVIAVDLKIVVVIPGLKAQT
jgi:phosphopantothenate synthetase